MQVLTLSYRDKLPEGYIEIDCTSRGKKWRQLSPFINRSIATIDGLVAQNMENLWQFSKVYKDFLDVDSNILPTYYDWRLTGFADRYANRYPMGKGVI